jgi:hypothetical protein
MSQRSTPFVKFYFQIAAFDLRGDEAETSL